MNEKPFPLDRLSIGSSAVVSRLEMKGTQKSRMIDLGFTPGAVVKSLHHSPAGDPTAYSIMGAVIALRNEDAARIFVERRAHEKERRHDHCPGGKP